MAIGKTRASLVSAQREDQEQTFVAHAVHPQGGPTTAETEQGNTHDNEAKLGDKGEKKAAVMIYLDHAMLAKIDARAKARGMKRSAWTQYVFSWILKETEL